MIDKIKDYVKVQWRLFPLQIFGAGILIPAFVVAVLAARKQSLDLTHLAWLILAVVGVIDLVIIYKGRKIGVKTLTITQWVRALLPKKTDLPVMLGFIVLVWWLVGPLLALFYTHGFLNNHFNEDR